MSITSKMPAWVPSTLISLVIMTSGVGGFYALTNWRLNAIEARQSAFDVMVQNKEEIAILKTRLVKYEERLSDDTFADWLAFRTSVTQSIENLDSRMDRLERN